jgi:hypothetical protein
MLIHLESGICERGINCEEMDYMVYQRYESEGYANGRHQYHRYRCPACQLKFRFLSGLFQHVESKACGRQSKETIAELKGFIRVIVTLRRALAMVCPSASLGTIEKEPSSADWSGSRSVSAIALQMI